LNKLTMQKLSGKVKGHVAALAVQFMS